MIRKSLVKGLHHSRICLRQYLIVQLQCGSGYINFDEEYTPASLPFILHTDIYAVINRQNQRQHSPQTGELSIKKNKKKQAPPEEEGKKGGKAIFSGKDFISASSTDREVPKKIEYGAGIIFVSPPSCQLTIIGTRQPLEQPPASFSHSLLDNPC